MMHNTTDGNIVYTILLNYNNWEDTIECINSLINIDYNLNNIIIVDNCSTNNSIKEIIFWVEKEGRLKSIENAQIDISNLSFIKQYSFNCGTLTLIKSKKNCGFGGGNNVGIKFIKANYKYNLIWFLNNDTIVDKKSLTELVKTINNTPNSGVCGSKIMHYDIPNKVQMYGGGVVNKIFGTTKRLTKIKQLDKLDYIAGVSMVVSKDYIKKVGLWPEDYFMYYEDTEYGFMAKKMGFKLNVALNSIIYHKGGRSSGMQSVSNRNQSMELMAIKNRIKFSKRNLHNSVGIKCGLIITIINRIIRRRIEQAYNIYKLILNYSEIN